MAGKRKNCGAEFKAKLAPEAIRGEPTVEPAKFLDVDLDPFARPSALVEPRGFGRESGPEHIDEYMNTKAIWIMSDDAA